MTTELHTFPDAERGLVVDPKRLVAQGELTDIGLLRHGTTSGKATVSMLVTLPDGSQVFAQTTWALFHTAAVALAASPIAVEETTFDA